MRWPDPLVKDIASRRAVLFVGSGVSRHSIGNAGKRPPLWRELLGLGCSQCRGCKADVARYIARGDLLTATEILATELGDAWHDLLQQEFVTPKYQPATIHAAIFSLDLRFVLTGNVDKIYDSYAQQASRGTIALKTYSEDDAAAMMRDRDQMVLKVHGTIDRKSGMIFSRSQYSEAKARHSGFFRMLEALFLTNTVLFLGCSLDDPDIQMLLEQSARWAVHSRPHYLCSTQKAGRAEKAALRRAYNIEIVHYSDKDEHAELAAGVAELSEKVDAARTAAMIGDIV